MLAVCAACAMASCDNTPIIEVDNAQHSIKENMINANRVVAKSEETQIDGYLQRRGWQMQELQCRARMRVYESGKGMAIANDDSVAVRYQLEALDGSIFYSNQIDTLVAGRQQVTIALDEALLKMHYGDKAWVIAPSDCAYGVVGDGDRVGSRTVIVYNILECKRI